MLTVDLVRPPLCWEAGIVSTERQREEGHDKKEIIEKIEKNQDLVETIFYVGPLNREVNEAEDRHNHYSYSIENKANQL